MTSSATPDTTEQAPTVSVMAEAARLSGTSHIKAIPHTNALREQLRQRCVNVAARLDKSLPLPRDEMERLARAVLAELGQPEGFLGWTMVTLASEFWREQVAAVPPSRRLLLLPHCLRHSQGCPADYDDVGLRCTECGACSIGDFRARATALGYQVLVAEGSPIVLKIIVSGQVDALVGVACLNVLEKALEKILLAGIPCMAVPLLSSDCSDTSVDEHWVDDMILTRRADAVQHTRTYIHLMRAAANLFDAEELDRLAPRLRGGPRLAETNGQGLAALAPLAGTEALAYDFLVKGGKHSRPFITLAVYDALTGGHGTLPDGADHVARFSMAVKRVALSIETFHKASLIHDDLEDDDPFRYGEPTLHRKYGAPLAINLGDFLIGLGYRLVGRETAQLGKETVADILAYLAESHTKLAEGQGAELLWRSAQTKRIQPLDTLTIYALKTAPAFEAALYAGVRLAGPAEGYAEPIKQFARHLGVAFQIQNDLNDWRGDDFNKLAAGTDALSGRPTILLALAWEGLQAEGQCELAALLDDATRPAEIRLNRVRQLYHEAGVFDKARRLVEKYRARAQALAKELQPEELQRLFHYLIDAVLDRSHHEPVELVEPAELLTLPFGRPPVFPPKADV